MPDCVPTRGAGGGTAAERLNGQSRTGAAGEITPAAPVRPLDRRGVAPTTLIRVRSARSGSMQPPGFRVKPLVVDWNPESFTQYRKVREIFRGRLALANEYQALRLLRGRPIGVLQQLAEAFSDAAARRGTRLELALKGLWHGSVWVMFSCCAMLGGRRFVHELRYQCAIL